MNEVTFTYTYMGIKFVLVCDENHELKAKYCLTKLGVDSYEELKALHGGPAMQSLTIEDIPTEVEFRLAKKHGIVGRVPAVMPQKLNPKYIRLKKED